MERQALSIRRFSSVCGVSHTEITRRMKDQGITGQPQGKGKPTLLSPAEQDQLAADLFVPSEPTPTPSPQIEVISGGVDVYSPTPLATRGTDSGLSRNLQAQQLAQSLETFKSNRTGFRNALLGIASENGRQLGHEMAIVEMNEALATHGELQAAMGKQLGVVPQGAGSDS